jgi:DNA-binding MarR family transcriptional regulator
VIGTGLTAPDEACIEMRMPHVTAEDLDRCLQVRDMCACNQLRRASRGVTQHYETGMAPGGVKVTQLPILVALGSEGDLSITRLAGALSLERTSLTRNLSVLEGRGLISVVEHGGDARVRMVSLTREGARVLAGALAYWREMQNAVEERFGRPRLEALYDELEALSNAVSERHDT